MSGPLSCIMEEKYTHYFLEIILPVKLEFNYVKSAGRLVSCCKIVKFKLPAIIFRLLCFSLLPDMDEMSAAVQRQCYKRRIRRKPAYEDYKYAGTALSRRSPYRVTHHILESSRLFGIPLKLIRATQRCAPFLSGFCAYICQRNVGQPIDDQCIPLSVWACQLPQVKCFSF